MRRSFVGLFVLFIGNFLLVSAQNSVEEGENLLKKGEVKRAKLILSEHRDEERAKELLGDIASFNKNWEEAINYYENLVKEQPNKADYHFKLGGAMGMKAMEGSKFQAALMVKDIKNSFLKAAELDKEHVQARRALVEFYMQIPVIIGGSREVAENYVKELKELNRVDAHLAQAYIHKVEEETEQAKEEVQKAINAAGKNKDLLSRNYLFFELGERAATFDVQPVMAAQYLETYIANYDYRDLKSPAWAYFHLAKIKVGQNDKDEALKNINRALAHKVRFPEAEKEKQRILEM